MRLAASLRTCVSCSRFLTMAILNSVGMMLQQMNSHLFCPAAEVCAGLRAVPSAGRAFGFGWCALTDRSTQLSAQMIDVHSYDSLKYSGKHH